MRLTYPTALVLQALLDGHHHGFDIMDATGLPSGTVYPALGRLERDGLVQRTVHPVVPPKVEYSLTKLGRTLIEPLQGLCRWSEKHLGELQANRARAKVVAAGVDRGT